MPPTENRVTISQITQWTGFRWVMTRTAETKVVAARIKNAICESMLNTEVRSQKSECRYNLVPARPRVIVHGREFRISMDVRLSLAGATFLIFPSES